VYPSGPGPGGLNYWLKLATGSPRREFDSIYFAHARFHEDQIGSDPQEIFRDATHADCSLEPRKKNRSAMTQQKFRTRVAHGSWCQQSGPEKLSPTSPNRP
jgi:hypothetical protein